MKTTSSMNIALFDASTWLVTIQMYDDNGQGVSASVRMPLMSSAGIAEIREKALIEARTNIDAMLQHPKSEWLAG